MSSLSILSFIKLLNHLSLDEIKIFMNGIGEYPMIIGAIFAGWRGIDTPLCVKLIYLSTNFVNGKSFHRIPKMDDARSKEIYTIIYRYYKSDCEKQNLKFVPCIKGLETIIRRKK